MNSNSTTSSQNLGLSFSDIIPLNSNTSVILMNALFLLLIIASIFFYFWRLKRRKVPKSPAAQQTIDRYNNAGSWLPGEAPPYAIMKCSPSQGMQPFGLLDSSLVTLPMDEDDDEEEKLGHEDDYLEGGINLFDDYDDDSTTDNDDDEDDDDAAKSPRYSVLFHLEEKDDVEINAIGGSVMMMMAAASARSQLAEKKKKEEETEEEERTVDVQSLHTRKSSSVSSFWSQNKSEDGVFIMLQQMEACDDDCDEEDGGEDLSKTSTEIEEKGCQSQREDIQRIYDISHAA